MLKFLNSRIGGALVAIALLATGLYLWTVFRENTLMEQTGITVGHVSKVHSGWGSRHSGPSVTIDYYVDNKKYKASFNCSKLVIGKLAIGTPFEIEYSQKSEWVANVNHTRRIGVGDDVDADAWIIDLYHDEDGVVELIYEYEVKDKVYSGADFLDTDLIIRRGDQFGMVYSQSNPKISKLTALTMQSMDGVSLDSLAYFDSLREVNPTGFRN